MIDERAALSPSLTFYKNASAAASELLFFNVIFFLAGLHFFCAFTYICVIYL